MDCGSFPWHVSAERVGFADRGREVLSGWFRGIGLLIVGKHGPRTLINARWRWCLEIKIEGKEND